MGRKGEKKHLKRKTTPTYWTLHRKETAWTVKPNPGPHSISRGIPLGIVLRDILKLATTMGEVETITSKGTILVDGRIRRETHFAIGLMDVLSIPTIQKWYRVLPSKKGLFLHPIGKEEAGFKLCRIENKTSLNGDHVQLNLHDGRNAVVTFGDANKTEREMYKPFDTIHLSLPDQEIVGHVKLSEGTFAIIVGGKNRGRYGKIVNITRQKFRKLRKSLLTLEDERGNRFQTTIDYAFMIGDIKPHISLPEIN